MIIKRAIKKLPFPINLFLTTLWGKVPTGLRLGDKYRKKIKMLNQAYYWDPEIIREWQLNRLKDIVRYASLKVPWYRETYKSIGFNWEDLKSIEDIEKLPLINKQIVGENTNKFIADGININQVSHAVTGGSTGKPLNLYLEKKSSAVELAFKAKILQQFDCKLGDRVLILRAQLESQNPKTPYWTYYPHRTELAINTYLMSNESIKEIAKKIRQFKPKYVRAIPSTVAQFCHYLLEIKESIGYPPKFVLLSSENSYRKQRELISKVFNCQTIMKYGLSEGVVVAVENKQYENYNVNPFYGFAEIIKTNKELAVKKDEQGEIIGTSFYNYVMPLIRYRTGDIATIAEGASSWGIEGNLWKSIDGRTVELIKTKDSRWIMVAALLFGTHDDTFSNVDELQIEQEKPGILTMRIIKGIGYTSNDEKMIKKMISDLSKGGFDLRFQYVDVMKKTGRGKHKLLIQHLNIPEYMTN